ncbi:MAG: LCP family protein [Clostridia bacterium]|nr:LCP family protein [Clostridia bacterium]
MTERKETNKKNKKRLSPILKIWAFLLIVSMGLGIFTGIRVMTMDIGERIAISLDDHEPGGVVNILLMGTDDGGDRCDTIMLVNLNGETGKLNVLSIPRDTAIASRNSKGNIIYNSAGVPVYNKINAYMAIGKQEVNKGNIKVPEELLIRKVKEITGLPIHYFATVDFEGFINIIDALGGVDFDVPENMNYDDPYQNLHIHLKKGMQHLNGKEAHDLVRFRNYNNGQADLARVDTQQKFIKELIRQKLTVSNLNKIDEIYEVVNENVRTNYSFEVLMQSFGTIKNLSPEKVTMYVLPNTPKWINGASYVVYNTRDNMEQLDEILDNFRSEKDKEK